MTEFKEFIGDNDVLTRVTRYQLERDEGRVIIDVHEIIAEEGKENFIAHPNWISG